MVNKIYNFLHTQILGEIVLKVSTKNKKKKKIN